MSSSPEADATKQTEMKQILPIRIISKIVPGFGRGSKDLGIPTANLSSSSEDLQCKITFESLPTGIYYGFARLEPSPTNSLNEVYKAAISIGYNPCYNNEHKTIEPHLIASPEDPLRNSSACEETLFHDLYNETMRVSIVGYLRPELPFEGLDKLTLAIKGDIVKTEELCDGEGEVLVGERCWVESSSDAV